MRYHLRKFTRALALVLLTALLSLGLMGCTEKQIDTALSVAEALLETESSSQSAASDVPEEVAASETQETSETAAEAPSEAPSEAAAADSSDVPSKSTPVQETPSEATLDKDGSYDQKDDVALYLHLYGQLPSNYISKKKAQNAGWTGGSVEQYCPGKCIGGSYFGNNEGILPDGEYHECDIATLGKSSRGAKRIVYSDKGEIYYTGDHYETFTLLYTADGPVTEKIVYGGKKK